MQLIYFAHPLGAHTPKQVVANLEQAKRWLSWVYKSYPECAVIADWILEVELRDAPETNVITEGAHVKRILGLQRDDAHIRVCSQFWVFGWWSTGCTRGLETARQHNKSIYDFTSLGDNIPTGPLDTDEFRYL